MGDNTYWLKKRLAELHMTQQELADDCDSVTNISTVKNWLYAKRVRWYPDEKDKWDDLTNSLDWTMLDVLQAIGYDLPLDIPPEIMQLGARYNKLSDAQKEVVLMFWASALELAEQTDITSDDLP